LAAARTSRCGMPSWKRGKKPTSGEGTAWILHAHSRAGHGTCCAAAAPRAPHRTATKPRAPNHGWREACSETADSASAVPYWRDHVSVPTSHHAASPTTYAKPPATPPGWGRAPERQHPCGHTQADASRAGRAPQWGVNKINPAKPGCFFVVLGRLVFLFVFFIFSFVCALLVCEAFAF